MSNGHPQEGQLGWAERARVFRRKPVNANTTGHPARPGDATHDQEKGNVTDKDFNPNEPQVNHNGHKVTQGIQPAGESGRRWISPLKMLKICWRSSCTASKYTNIFWPFTIAALVLYFHYREHYVWVFTCAYIGMVPCANLVGFAGQELARKLPSVAGVMLETTFGSVVEIILFMVLIRRPGDEGVPIIRAAILGSLLANMLLCLGLCFFVGGIYHPQQSFHEAVSEVGSNLMLVAGMALIIPAIYYQSLYTRLGGTEAESEALKISRATAIILLVAFVAYVYFQIRSHHGLYEDILEADEERDHDRHRDLAKDKLTLTECIVALAIALTFVSFMAVILVSQIEKLTGQEEGYPHRIKDAFVGLILIPVVEKAAEHITAVDEAYDNQMNFALSHVLGASIQTALLNTPLVVLVGWGLGKDMSLNFEIFDAAVVILAIIVVGSFLRDEKSDYLEGLLCVCVYVLIAVCAFYYPDPQVADGTSSGESTGESTSASMTSVAAEATGEVVRRLLVRTM